MPAMGYRKGAGNEVHYPVFPAVTGTPGIRPRCRRFPRALQEPLYDSPSNAAGLLPFFEFRIAVMMQDTLYIP
jgi:hypothetical protein